MDSKDTEKTVQLYKKRFEQHKHHVKALGWGSKEKQYLRFDILSQIADLNDKRILDVGCGFGDFYNYLNRNNINVDYTGFDLIEEMIDVAKKRYPEAKFYVKNILTDHVDNNFDYVFMSGTISNKISDNLALAKNILSRMFNLCRLGVAANMLSMYVEPKHKSDISNYYDPIDIFRYCKELCPLVTLRHDYPLADFTVYIYKSKKPNSVIKKTAKKTFKKWPAMYSSLYKIHQGFKEIKNRFKY